MSPHLPRGPLAPKATEDRALFGIGLVLLAYAMFSMVDASAKWLAVYGYPAMQLAFMRYVAHFFISGARIVSNGWSWRYFYTKHPLLVVVRGLLILAATVFNFIALKYIPLTLTSTILFSAPIIVCLLSGTVLGERVGPWRWLAIVLGFAGVLVAIRPFDESFHWAALLSLAGATSFSFYILLTRRLSGIVASDTMQFYAGLVGCTLLFPFALVFWQEPESLAQWMLLIGLGVFAWIGHEFLTRAFGYADASLLTPYTYSFMIYLTIWSVILFDHFPDHWTMTGAAIIVSSGLLIWTRERKTRQPGLFTKADPIANK